MMLRWMMSWLFTQQYVDEDDTIIVKDRDGKDKLIICDPGANIRRRRGRPKSDAAHRRVLAEMSRSSFKRDCDRDGRKYRFEDWVKQYARTSRQDPDTVRYLVNRSRQSRRKK
jgi:hypothetical protein